ncbi:kinase/pyrophosphorylase [Geobacter pelophilus]|jgi:regulator of PEP synthase PpsR (kinase-PPPase family)|uniref:Putative pyruvate, phosphate dikinase regulatory protein n=1 Tax=Geoanaerobacter pelophilus TaxID=60036 RepID=A0AAW4L292_9BACT|nr:pyruvate, water dikinase regulatory protein [Geoanaerobacter pelophilus]MBT0664844.1 kinase/pyrophosphorylase [Geoanaerobacter pelophilus]
MIKHLNEDAVQHLYLLSDSTGETVERVVRAALSQFQGGNSRLHRLSGLRSRADIDDALAGPKGTPGLIIYTLVNPDLAEYLRNEVEHYGLDAIDLISPLLYKLSDLLGRAPREEPGLLHQVDTEYFKRVEAVNFTVKQDDGQELRHLYRADMVLVGVSRTSKTPLSIYLAHKGYKVANVPLVKGIEPPRELFEIDQKKVVGLLIDARRLVELRSARLRNLRQNPRGSYADFEVVEDELEWCRRIYRNNSQWQVIDVTNKSVEESAAEILRRVNDGVAA